MHLDNRQLAILLFPFAIAIFTYFFSDNIAQNLKYFFPEYEEYTNKNLNKKATIYLKIEAKNQTYLQVIDKMKNREQNSDWINNNVFYSQKPNKDSATDTDKKSTEPSQENRLTLQMSAPSKGVAIISGQIVKLNSTIHNAKLISIEERRVLLQYKEKQKWLYMFQ